jgi:hypothetical protein
VYKGWDMTKNSFVAVKQVSLHNIPKEQLYGIMVCDISNSFAYAKKKSGRLVFGWREANFLRLANDAIIRSLSI